MTVIGIIGSRTFNNYSIMHNIFNNLIDKLGYDFIIISGGAKGADFIAEHEAKIRNIKTIILKPDFSKGYDVREYFKRNDEIVKLSDKIIALWDGISNGTAYTIQKAIDSNKPVEIIKI